jgi:hypothetical protein
LHQSIPFPAPHPRGDFLHKPERDRAAKKADSRNLPWQIGGFTPI